MIYRSFFSGPKHNFLFLAKAQALCVCVHHIDMSIFVESSPFKRKFIDTPV